MRIGNLAQLHGVSRDTLRFYERRGLIRPDRGVNGYRDYSEQTSYALTYIRRAQALGFTLAEIETDLRAMSDVGLSQERIAELLRGKLKEVDQRLSRLASLRQQLAAMIDDVCPILAASGSN